MKKVSTLLLLFLFLIANSGMAVNIHWCGGKLSSIELNIDKKSKCGCGKETMKPNCCEDSSFHLKASDEFSKTTYECNLKQPVAKVAFLLNFYRQNILSCEFILQHYQFEIPPPLISKEPLFVRTGSFLI
ncbi:MAG TPA: hypothetical protein VFW78_09395 [Bacteroidia bacterium]|nr:hypothetical protein [Bacteroidia bacterium]